MQIHIFRKKLRHVYLNSPVKLHFLQRLYSKLKKIRNQDRVVTKTVDGITYELHLNEFIDSQIYYYGCFEEDTTRVMADLVQPGMMVLDIGANIGAHTLRLAQILGEEGRVIAFEPMEWAQKRLKTNMGLNSFNNITLEKIALSDKDSTGAAAFRTSWNTYDKSSDGIEPEDNIKFEMLDAYVARKKIDKIDFIKLDVDGFEYKILKGAKEALQQFKPTLSMELGNWTLEKQGDTLQELVTYLESLGFKVFRESDLKLLPNFEAIIQEFPDSKTWTINVVIIHKSKIQSSTGQGLDSSDDPK